MCMVIQKQITIQVPEIMNPYNRRDKRSSLRAQAVIPRCALLKAYRHFTTLRWKERYLHSCGMAIAADDVLSAFGRHWIIYSSDRRMRFWPRMIFLVLCRGLEAIWSTRKLSAKSGELKWRAATCSNEPEMSCGEGCPRTKAVPHGPQTATAWCSGTLSSYLTRFLPSQQVSIPSGNIVWSAHLTLKPFFIFPNCFELIAICACSLGNDNHALNVI